MSENSKRLSPTEDDHESQTKELRSVETLSAGADLEYPEGGRDAVMTLIGTFLANVVLFGVVSLVGVLQAYYAGNQLKGMSESKISWIGTLCLFFHFFFAAFVGRAFDSVGPTILLSAGSFLVVFGLMMVSLCKEYYQFIFAQGVVVGVGTSLVFYPALSALAHWYDKKRGTVMGLTTAGSSIGAVIFPIALNNLIPIIGFGWAVRTIAFICIALLVPMILLVKARLPRRDFGGISAVLDFSGFKDTRYLLFTIGGVAIGLGFYNPYFYSQTFSETRGYTSNVSFYIVAIQNAGSLPGRIIPGMIADRFGVVNLMALSSTFAATILLCWMSVSDPAGLVVWGSFYGFCSGSFLSLAPVCIARFTSDMSRYGGRTGLFFGLIGFSVLVSAPIAGALLDQDHGRFTRLIVFSGITYLAGAMCVWAARFAGNRRLFVKC